MVPEIRDTWQSIVKKQLVCFVWKINRISVCLITLRCPTIVSHLYAVAGHRDTWPLAGC